MPRRSLGVALAAIIGLALLVRLVHFAAIASTVYPDLPTVFTNSDMHAFLRWAETILAGDVLGRDTYHPYNDWMERMAPLETWYRWWGSPKIFQETPFYPYWLAAVLGVSGRSLRFVLLVQLVLGALQPLIVFALGRRLFDARTGLVAAAITALYGPLVFQEGTLLRDWLPPIVEPLALVLLVRARAAGAWALAGAVMGLAFLVKESIVLFLPLALLWAAWTARGGIAIRVRPAACVLGGFLVAVSPLLIRNALVGAPVLAVSNRTAEGFIIGNAADAFPVASYFPASLGDILRRTDGRPSAVVRETLATYQGDWRAFLAMLGLKARALVDPFEAPNNLSFQYGREISPVLRVLLGWVAILPLGVAGLVVVADRWRRHLLLLLYGIAAVAGLLATGVVGRYRLPLVPVLAIYAGAGLTRAVTALRARRPRPAVAFLALAAALSLLQQAVAPIRRLREDPRLSVYMPEYTLAARLYADQGRWDRAVDEVSRLRLAVERAGMPREYREQALMREGGYRAMWAQNLIQRQDRVEARRQVGEVERLYAHTEESSVTHYDLGALYLALDDLPRARVEFERFLAIEPRGTRADGVRGLLARRFGTP